MKSRGTVLITGPTGGIGLELTKIFAARGYNLVLVGRDKKKLAEVAKNIGGVIKTIAVDLAKPSAPQRIYDEVKKDSIEIDILVNNAGFGVHGSFAETDLQKELEMMQVNMITLTHLTKLFMEDILMGGGKILNVASTAAFEPGPTMAVYFATKAYVFSLSQALASELKGSDVIVSSLCPGATQTGFAEGANIQSTKLFQYAMRPRTVALAAYRGLMQGKHTIVPGLVNKLLVFSTRFIPRSILTALVKLTLKKT